MQSERVAWHEAGHAVSAYLLGGRIVGPVSIRPTKRWSGVAHVRGPTIPADDLARVDRDLPVCTYPN
jgi:hypothetical protein